MSKRVTALIHIEGKSNGRILGITKRLSESAIKQNNFKRPTWQADILYTFESKDGALRICTQGILKTKETINAAIERYIYDYHPSKYGEKIYITYYYDDGCYTFKPYEISNDQLVPSKTIVQPDRLVKIH